MSVHLSNVTGVERRRKKNSGNFLSIFLFLVPPQLLYLPSVRGWFTQQSTSRRNWRRKWFCRKLSEETWYAARLGSLFAAAVVLNVHVSDLCLPDRTRAPCTTAWWSSVTPWEPAPLLSCPSCSGLSTQPSTATLTLRPVAFSGESPVHRNREAALERVSHPLRACLRRKLLNTRLAFHSLSFPPCSEAARVQGRPDIFVPGGTFANFFLFC